MYKKCVPVGPIGLHADAFIWWKEKNIFIDKLFADTGKLMKVCKSDAYLHGKTFVGFNNHGSINTGPRDL